MNLSLPLFDPPNDALASTCGVHATLCRADHAGVDQPDCAETLPCAGVRKTESAVDRATQLTALHPGLWRASQIGGAPGRVTASGFDTLDAELPGGGWPHGVLTELLLARPGVGELRLLAPALAAVAPLCGAAGAPPAALASGRHALSDPGRCVMLFDPPASLSAWALLQCGLDSRHWLVVQARAGQGPAPWPVPLSAPRPADAGRPPWGSSKVAKPHLLERGLAASGSQHGAPRSANRLAPLLPSADLLWALEQSLKSGHVGVILAWLPLKLGADALRRLQIAAQAQDGPVFVFRDAQARSQPSPAPLRLLLQPAGVDGLSLRLLKRRGPSLDRSLRLTLPSALTPRQQAQAQARDLTRPSAQTTQGVDLALTLAGSLVQRQD